MTHKNIVVLTTVVWKEKVIHSTRVGHRRLQRGGDTCEGVWDGYEFGRNRKCGSKWGWEYCE